MGGANKVGELHVDISARGVAPTVAEINKVKDAGNAAATATTTAAQSIKGATKPVRDFQQAVRGITSSFFGWFAIIGTVTTGLTLLGKGISAAVGHITGLTKAVSDNEAAIRKAAKTASEAAAKGAVDLVPQPSIDRIKEAGDEIPRLSREVAQARNALAAALTGGPSTSREIIEPLEKAVKGAEARLKKAQDLLNRVNQDIDAGEDAAAIAAQAAIDSEKDAAMLAEMEVAALRRHLRRVDEAEQREIIREIEAAKLESIKREAAARERAANEQRQFVREMLAEQRRAFQEALNQMVVPLGEMVRLLNSIKNNTRQ